MSALHAASGLAVLVIAHFGHWYISGPVYLAPVLALIAYMKLSTWRERRRKGRPDARRAQRRAKAPKR